MIVTTVSDDDDPNEQHSDSEHAPNECESDDALPGISPQMFHTVDNRMLAKQLGQLVGGGGSGRGDDGETRIGRYRILRRIGRGAMGIVWQCWDEPLAREVAVKLLDNPNQPRSAERFRREAQALARLDHPNVVKIYDFGESEWGSFFAMEYVDGPNLRDWLEQLRESTPTRSILNVLLDAARGLEAAHARGLVHRDFKPENVLVDMHGAAKVADFGLVRDQLPTQPTLTHEATAPAIDVTTRANTRAAGTPPYMAPEQLRCEPAIEASDQFAFCVTAYEAIWRKRPFPNEEHRGGEIDSHEIVPPEGLRPLFMVLQRGLNFDPVDRWPSMTELIEALELVCERPARRWRWLARGGLAIVSSVLVLFAAQIFASEIFASEPCQTSDILPDPTRAQLSESLARFEPSGPDSEQVCTRIIAELDDWVERWDKERSLLCEPGKRDAEVRDRDQFDHRERCLDAAAERLDALVQRIIAGGSTNLDDVVIAVQELPDPHTCNGFDPLGGFAAPAPSIRPVVTASRRELERARVARMFGRWDEARASAARALEFTSKLDYRPLLAEIRAEQAMIEDTAGRYSLARDHYDAAWRLAEGQGLDALAGRLMLERAELEMNHLHDFDAARLWLQQAEAKAERLELDRRRTARLAYAHGRLAQLDGNLAEAELRFREAIEMVTDPEASASEVSWVPELPEYLDALAFVVVDANVSLALRQSALDLARKHFGPYHPRTAKRLYNYGAALQDRDGSGARERQQAAAIWATQGNEPSDWQARAAHEFAASALLVGELEVAERHAQDMAKLLEQLGPDAHEHGEPELLLAQVEAMRADRSKPDDAPTHRREAIVHLRRALADFRSTPASTIRDPRVAVARLLLANQLMEVGELDEAAQELERVLGDSNTEIKTRARLRMAELALRRGELERAAVELTYLERVRQFPNGERLIYEVLRSIVDARLGRLDDAQRKALHEARKAEPMIDAVLDGWLDQLGVDDVERAELGLTRPKTARTEP